MPCSAQSKQSKEKGRDSIMSGLSMREGNRNLGHYVNTCKPTRLIAWFRSEVKKSVCLAWMCLRNVLNFGFLTSFAWLHVFWHCSLQLHSFSGKLDTIRLIAWLRFKFGLESSNQSVFTRHWNCTTLNSMHCIQAWANSNTHTWVAVQFKINIILNDSESNKRLFTDNIQLN